MTEDFLHYIWKYRLFDKLQLKTFAGQDVEVINPGQQNSDSGPDFFNAKIRIGGQTWAGNVEIHIKASDWFKHGHQHDKAYDSILLHVVYENDLNENDHLDKLVILKQAIKKSLLANYEAILSNQEEIPCAKQLKHVDDFIINAWLERLLVERLENKTRRVFQQLELNKNNLEEAFYIQLARNFGFNTNALPFELLAKSLPIKFLAKHKNNLPSLEALLFGQAGMLDGNYKDDYPLQLQKEYKFLKQKYALKPIDGHLWKYLRLRPANFPAIRVAQFAQLVYKSNHLLSKIIENAAHSNVLKLFELKASAYWNTHYVFDKQTELEIKTLGKTAIDSIIINTVAPFLFVCGLKQENDKLKEQAIKLLQQTKAENNHIIKKWNAFGIKAFSSAESQALLELKNNYCNFKKCLNCGIGLKILGKQNE